MHTICATCQNRNPMLSKYLIDFDTQNKFCIAKIVLLFPINYLWNNKVKFKKNRHYTNNYFRHTKFNIL